MSAIKYHPLRKAKEAHVLAVRFGVDQWGFIRVHRGSALGIWDKWTRKPVAIPDDISDTPEKWFCYYLSPKQDDTEMIELGSLPFNSDEAAWAPACFYRPDIFQNHYRIYFRGMFREASEDDIEGIHPCERLNPIDLVQRLQKLFSEGLLMQGPTVSDSERPPALPGCSA